MKESVVTDERDERIWRCHCHYSPHFVSITADPSAPEVTDDPRSLGWFTVEVTDGPWPFTTRVREAWKLLRSRGHSYAFGEVVLDPVTATEIRDHLDAGLARVKR